MVILILDVLAVRATLVVPSGDQLSFQICIHTNLRMRHPFERMWVVQVVVNVRMRLWHRHRTVHVPAARTGL